MKNLNQMQPLEAGESVHPNCAPPCNGVVCVPWTHYDELLRAKSELDILRRAYQTMYSYSMDHIMDTIFDPSLKYKHEPTQTTAPTSEAETTSARSVSDAE